MYCGCIMYLQNVYVKRFISNGSSVTALCVCVRVCTHRMRIPSVFPHRFLFLFCEIINGLI